MNKYNFFIPGRLPDLNGIIEVARGNKYASAVQKRENTERVKNIFQLTFRDYKPLKRVWIKFCWVEPNKRKNPDNICAGKKYVIDGLVNAGLLKNDGWGEIAGFSDTWDLGEPGVWISIQEV